MADGDMGEKTEQPTARRLSEARNKGQIAKSQDLSAAINLLAAMLVLLILGGFVAATLARLVERVLSNRTLGAPLDVSSLPQMVRYASGETLWLVAPMLLIFFGVAYIAQLIQVGPLLTTYPIKPKLSNLNPINGAKKLFNRRNMVKTVVNTLKLVVVCAVSYLFIALRIDTLSVLPKHLSVVAMVKVVRLAIELGIVLAIVLLFLAIIDYIYQRWQHNEELKMTKQEVKDERRSMEGDPAIKRKRFQMYAEIAGQRIAQAVPEADVVVTNPTHFSVAIKYDQDGVSAPRVTAKGADEVALRIRHIAQRHDVPIVQRPPLARALYWGIEVGQEIAAEHYEAVAEILAYVYRLDEAKASRVRERAAAAASS